MAKVTRVFPYVNGRQTFTMPNGYDSRVTYHAWAGGGAAGGDTGGQQGGNGSAGTYTTGQVFINPGDEVQIFVGQGGQEGTTLQGNKKLYSMTLPGRPNSGRGNPAVYGYVNDPTQAVYPIYNDRLNYRTYGVWSTFMNAWAVSNLPNNQPGTEDVTCNVYFPAAGSYPITIAGDNKITVYFRDQLIQAEVSDTFRSGKEITKSITVPEAGVYPLRYVLVNASGSSGNPAGAAIVIYRNALSGFGNGATNTPYQNNILWTTRFGTNVDVSNRVSIFYAPLVPFYEPAYPVLTGQSESYDWSGFGDKCMAVISATSTFTESDLALLNLTTSQVLTIGYPVQVTCTGNIDDYFTSGYYTFTRGDTWARARYSWSGNPAGTMVYKTGSGNPSNWTEKFTTRYTSSSRQRNVSGGNWTLPVPPDNTIYIVGFSDGLSNSNWVTGEAGARGSDNLQWTISSIQGQSYAGGKGGNSAVNLGQINYYGGYGGQIGATSTSGGGGGAGGATLLLKKTKDTNTVSTLAVAGGGAGGGGAGVNLSGENAGNEYSPASAYPNTIGAGQAGINSPLNTGGGGGGGGGFKGGAGGKNIQNGGSTGGQAGRPGDNLLTPSTLTPPAASLVMIGRGGDGTGGGGGGGAGELVISDSLKLRSTQFIQVGGSGEQRLEGDPSAIWWNDNEYITAGPGGRGGSPESAYGRNGNGQSGGCINGDTAVNRYGGSGGGAGVVPYTQTASGGAARTSKLLAGFTSYTTAGNGTSGAPAYASGGGGGAGGTASTGTQITTTGYQLVNPGWSSAVPVTSGLIPTYLGSKSPYNVWFPTPSSNSYSFYLKFTGNKYAGYGIIGNAYASGTITIGDSWSLNIGESEGFNAKYQEFVPRNTGYYKVTITAAKNPFPNVPYYGFAMLVMDNDLVQSYAYNSLEPGQYGMVWCTLNYGTPPAVYTTQTASTITNSIVYKSSDGGRARTVPLGKTGKTYTLGGGGGGSCGVGNQSPVNVGLGGGAGAGDGASGVGNELEYSRPGTYSFYVPRNVTTMNFQGVGAGGAGGNSARGGGGGGSGGYLPRTPYAVQFGQKVDVVVGTGTSGNGQNTVITLNAFGDIPTSVITLEGGRVGSSSGTIPGGGIGGSPNGQTGGNGGTPNGDSGQYWYSGQGANSPYGSGGQSQNSEQGSSQPGNGELGAGGGGGVNRAGGLGGSGYVKIDWTGEGSQNAQPNTGSGGGGGYDGGGGSGGSGFVAIAYAGGPIYKAYVDGREVAPIRQNGYTIHEFYSSGILTAESGTPGTANPGDGIYPAGTNVNGFVPGTALGGTGNTNLDVFPINPSAAYPAFLNAYGVWNEDPTSPTFSRTYYVSFPEYASYVFSAYADNGATVTVDGGTVLDLTPATRDNGTYWYKNGQNAVHKIQPGIHVITINATNTTAQGAFAMTIVKQGTTNPLIFNSRTPPVAGGSGVGGNGLLILELQGGEGTAQIKVDNDWKKLIGQWVKIGGVWKKITDSSVKIGGIWQSLFGAAPLSVTIDTVNWGGPSQPPVSGQLPPSPTAPSTGGGTTYIR